MFKVQRTAPSTTCITCQAHTSTKSAPCSCCPLFVAFSTPQSGSYMATSPVCGAADRLIGRCEQTNHKQLDWQRMKAILLQPCLRCHAQDCRLHRTTCNCTGMLQVAAYNIVHTLQVAMHSAVAAHNCCWLSTIQHWMTRGCTQHLQLRCLAAAFLACCREHVLAARVETCHAGSD
jgi:hypothetical protein